MLAVMQKNLLSHTLKYRTAFHILAYVWLPLPCSLWSEALTAQYEDDGQVET